MAPPEYLRLSKEMPKIIFVQRPASLAADVATPTAAESNLAMESAIAQSGTAQKRKRRYSEEGARDDGEESRRKRPLLLGVGLPIDEQWSDEGVVGGVESDGVEELEGTHDSAILFEHAMNYNDGDGDGDADDVWGHVRFSSEPTECFVPVLGFMDTDNEALLARDARADDGDGGCYGESSEMCGYY